MAADTVLRTDPLPVRVRVDSDVVHRLAIDLRRELSAARADITRLQRELDEARHLQQAAAEALGAARTELAATRQMIATMEKTVSWRVTTPLRVLDEMARAAFRRLRPHRKS